MTKVDNIKVIIERPDFDWYEEMVKSSTFGKKITKDQREVFIKKAMEQAEKFKNKLISEYGNKEPMGYIITFDIPLEYKKEEPTYGYQYLGYYRTKNKSIAVNYTTLNLIQKKCKEKGFNEVEIDKIKDTVLMHELFHYLEDLFPSDYTKEKHFETKTFGLFKSKINLSIISEITAVHFSKLMTKLKHSPKVYEYIYKKY
ncbi:hypothetical protein BN85403830 [Alteracholeplasma palmae J233]|uniref:Uncharacterized protein n=1 Tax=Alteracholeplasma palmae (strain ATCC 49389 / J233) TaxID=1318466 RepID=U4KP33_ALTPJ|nr:hypothetical protein [Alteracholeplasma palmae]CCV63960.1 hypothetical protein BN85403830 [Alteracholeplasma palmae J233]